ncbi:hypothetical protein H6F77_17500 [Microcoleus sp. FACHB-831]|nr:hypothetical protein [Microcoleus sp. FACHB-831]MBD1922850.1 hypothetical protein [Microcoleus sp. FACHB-831]
MPVIKKFKLGEDIVGESVSQGQVFVKESRAKDRVEERAIAPLREILV